MARHKWAATWRDSKYSSKCVIVEDRTPATITLDKIVLLSHHDSFLRLKKSSIRLRFVGCVPMQYVSRTSAAMSGGNSAKTDGSTRIPIFTPGDVIERPGFGMEAVDAQLCSLAYEAAAGIKLRLGFLGDSRCTCERVSLPPGVPHHPSALLRPESASQGSSEFRELSAFALVIPVDATGSIFLTFLPRTKLFVLFRLVSSVFLCEGSLELDNCNNDCCRPAVAARSTSMSRKLVAHTLSLVRLILGMSLFRRTIDTTNGRMALSNMSLRSYSVVPASM